jgi:hypothetical protein
MTTDLSRSITLAATLLLFAASAVAQLVQGTTGSDAGGDGGDSWQSSWLDIKPPISFKKGEILRIKVDGDAENVLVRLLPAASDSRSSDGIEGGVRKVPASKVIEVKLDGDRPNVKQISVHAGKKAWRNPLGGNNGSVTMVSVERSTK